MKDLKIWLFTLIWAFHTIGTTGLTFYLPTVIASLHLTFVVPSPLISTFPFQSLSFWYANSKSPPCRNLAQSQLLNIPVAVLAVIIIAAFGIWADTARLPRPLYPLSFVIVVLACYGVLYSFPNIGGVYAATVIASAVANSW
jgi:hypothetical protein